MQKPLLATSLSLDCLWNPNHDESQGVGWTVVEDFVVLSNGTPRTQEPSIIGDLYFIVNSHFNS